jgi:hypothetical protein
MTIPSELGMYCGTAGAETIRIPPFVSGVDPGLFDIVSSLICWKAPAIG